MKSTLIYNASIINDGEIKTGSVVIENEFIKEVIYNNINKEVYSDYNIIDATELYLIPGVIDDQVHFRDPGLTHKADIYTESKAAVAGGVTSFMEMPNTLPQTTTINLLEEKYKMASEKSLANYSFYLGATNNNIKEIKKINSQNTCGLKIFMGASTGNMLVDNINALEAIFAESPVLIATHCEDEQTIKNNIILFKEKYGEKIPIKYHPEIRNEESCFISSNLAVNLARKHNTRLHVLHISTERELELFQNNPLDENKRITNEVCVHHLWFDSNDYERKGTFIKWNPAIKASNNKEGLRKALKTNLIDVIATDHAPHTISEKENTYFKAPSGGPMVQHSLVAMLELSFQNIISIEEVVTKMCHNPAKLFNISKRGYIKKDYYADMVLLNLNSPWTVNKNNILYKCGWSPLENTSFKSKVISTIINGHLVYNNGVFDESKKGMRLFFNR